MQNKNFAYGEDNKLKIKTFKHNQNRIACIIKKKIKHIRSQNWVMHISDDNLVYLEKGTFGTIYENHENTLIKFSHTLKKINDSILKNHIQKHVLKKFLKEFDNELKQNEDFSKLKTMFPNNIMTINYTYRAFLVGDPFPVNVICMEKIIGLKVCDFLNESLGHDDNITFLKFVKKCLEIFLHINTNGYFHNDVSLKNIIIKKYTSTYEPVLIDYSFSKIINKQKLFPIECIIFVNQIKSFAKKNLSSDKLKLLLCTKFEALSNFMFNLYEKYCIYETVFIEKIMIGLGVFSYDDYANLPIILETDIENMLVHLNVLDYFE